MEVNSQKPLASLSPAKAEAPAVDALQRRKMAQEFTAFLYQEVLKAMRAAMPQGGLDEGESSMSRDFFTSMMDAEVAKVVARHDSSGVAKAVEKTLGQSLGSADKIPAVLSLPAPAKSSPAPSSVPALGPISSAYGLRADPFDGQSKFHQGIDIAAAAGSTIRAVAPGRVTFSGVAPGYGNMIEVDHGGGFTTRYGHNAKNLVRAGDHVDSGSAIGLVGRTGRATGDHLHFEARRDGRAVDPQALLADAPKGAKFSAKV